MAKNNSWNMDEDRVVITDISQTITGDKTFSGLIQVPSPSTINEAVNLGYMQGNTWNLVQSQTISTPVASINFTNIGSYNNYMFLFHDMHCDTNGTELWMQASVDNGTTFIGGPNYISQLIGASGAVVSASNVNSDDFRLTTQVLNTVTGVAGFLYLPFVNYVVPRKYCIGNTGYVNFSASTQTFLGVSGFVSTASVSNAALNAFRFLFSSGNITAGIISLYGAN